MIPCLVPEILPLDAFCDVVVVVAGVVARVVGIGDSRSWMKQLWERLNCNADDMTFLMACRTLAVPKQVRGYWWVLGGTGLYWGEVKGEGTGGRGNFD